MSSNEKPNSTLCAAPWVHSHVTVLQERTLCCIAKKKYSEDMSLKSYWNSDYLKEIRLKMLNNVSIDECSNCDLQKLSPYTYRTWFNSFYADILSKIPSITNSDGSISVRPISFDYRASSICNFRCKTCGPDASSSWRSFFSNLKTDASFGNISLTNNKAVIANIKQLESELDEAIENKVVKEIYWAGGEPTLWPFHWHAMEKIISLNLGDQVFVRYNTNLSILSKGTRSLYKDILPYIKNYKVYASIDGVGSIGEWIRYGFNTEKFIENFRLLQEVPNKKDCVILDVTLSLPALFSFKQLIDLAVTLDAQINLRMMHSDDPKIVMSPLALPKSISNRIWNDLIKYAHSKLPANQKLWSVVHTLNSFKERSNYEDLFKNSFESGFFEGRKNIKLMLTEHQKLAGESLTIEDIYSADPEVYKWWTRDECI